MTEKTVSGVPPYDHLVICKVLYLSGKLCISLEIHFYRLAMCVYKSLKYAPLLTKTGNAQSKTFYSETVLRLQYGLLNLLFKVKTKQEVNNKVV